MDKAIQAEPRLQLLRCDLQQPRCLPFATALKYSHITDVAVHPLTDEVFLAEAAAGQLLKLDGNGKLLARAPVAMMEHTVIRLESGLLFMSSPRGPAVSVFRYENSSFGQQLDEIVLLPPPAVAAEQSRVWDFLWSADNWWVVLYNPDTRSAGLYRFDEQWKYIDQAELAAGTWPDQLANWGGKILVRDGARLPVQRFSATPGCCCAPCSHWSVAAWVTCIICAAWSINPAGCAVPTPLMIKPAPCNGLIRRTSAVYS
jgi:hypothetical protein